MLALRYGERRHFLAILIVFLEPPRVGNSHVLSRSTEPIRRSELQRALRKGPREILVRATRIVHGAPHYCVFANAGEQRVRRLLDRAADVHRAGLYVPR